MVSSSIANKPNLVSLNLSHNRLERLDRRIFWTTPNLERLDLSDNALEGGLESLGACRKLAFVSVAGNRLASVASLAPLKLLKRLQTADVGRNPFLLRPLDLDALVAAVGCRDVRLSLDRLDEREKEAARDRRSLEQGLLDRRSSVVRVVKEDSPSPAPATDTGDAGSGPGDGGDSARPRKASFLRRECTPTPVKKPEIKPRVSAKELSSFLPIQRKLDFSNIVPILSKSNQRNNLREPIEKSSVSKHYRLRTTSKQSKPSVDPKTSPLLRSYRDHVFSSEVYQKKKFGTIEKYPAVTPFCPIKQGPNSTGQRKQIRHLAELSIFIDEFKKPELEPIIEANISPTNHEDTIKLLEMIGQSEKPQNIKSKFSKPCNKDFGKVYALEKVSSGLLKTKNLKKVFIKKQRNDSPPKIDFKQLVPTLKMQIDSKFERTQSIFKIKSCRNSIKRPLQIDIPN